MMAGKKLIEKDLIWCIGDGQSTAVLGEAWIPGVLNFLFQPDIFRCIKSIRAPDVRRVDRWNWLGDAKGGFTVKQCYLHAMRDKWQGIDLLPNLQGALKNRGVELETTCTFCGLEEEEMYHVLVDCPRINDIWSGSRFNYESRRWHNYFVEWLEVEGSTWSQDQLGMCAIALYLIWEARNAKRFSDVRRVTDQFWCRVAAVWDEVHD
ncbi:uncharacterized protein G2W53_035228 [Senna tora]|uniref:Reverse transcriptase zinc-binding domain-containing protein n=1 Tax=Senna tora TaxID=362788 RepID=A0A834ST71_9FABA|nr:uncharacterized protein G2W53_035228 [Senna tora]